MSLSKDSLFKGRIALLNGWTPGGSFAAAADYAALASRFAPCELTDLEAMKKGCIPIVPKVQGMDQKVFDEAIRRRGIKLEGFAVESVTLDAESEAKIDKYELRYSRTSQRR